MPPVNLPARLLVVCASPLVRSGLVAGLGAAFVQARIHALPALGEPRLLWDGLDAAVGEIRGVSDWLAWQGWLADPEPAPGLVFLLSGPELLHELPPAIEASAGGRIGLLGADAEPAAVVAAVQAVHSGLACVTGDWAARLRGEAAAQPPHDAPDWIEPLSGRELEVFALLSQGFNNLEIAARLGISRHTAKFHVSQILTKLGAASRTEAVAMGLRLGLVGV
ncbi:MAG: LuxR family transcriptional regulator [Aquabacterium sp.]|nr:MAG: LuxR family transcriptional regulator [Aquabacterium sp.]